MTVILSDIDAVLAAALREPRALVGTTMEAESLAEAADRHGVAAVLLHHAATAGVPLDSLEAPLRARAAGTAAAIAARDRESIRMLASLDRARVRHVVLKGLALAYTVYPQPWMRPRSDSDLLVRASDLPALDEVFRAEGYARLPHVRGDLTLPQRHYDKVDRAGAQHNWDVHWRLTSSHVLAEAPSDDEVWEHAGAVDAIGGAAAPALPHTLMIACVHRLAHHHDDPRLVWLWDIRLLLEAMSAEDVNEFGRLAARDLASASACGRSLAVARDLCGAPIPPVLLPLLDASSVATPAAFLWSGSRKRVTYLMGELRAMPAGRRLRALREHVFPSLSSMRERYPSAPRALLPLLYPWRLMMGVPKWLSNR